MSGRRVLAATVATGGVVALRRAGLRWGATATEVAATLPGDELIERADLTATRAIDVAAPPERVWAWVVQLGQGRGGFYSYAWLERLAGCKIENADAVVPAWQHLAPGDEVRLAPTVALEVAQVNPGQHLVLRGAVPVGVRPAPYDFTWAFTLRPTPGGSRLVVRERYACATSAARLLAETVSWVSLVMSARMLRGIRERAERPLPPPG